jgi:two-component system cell cycle sensor histidine kinase/response regulator CckA
VAWLQTSRRWVQEYGLGGLGGLCRTSPRHVFHFGACGPERAGDTLRSARNPQTIHPLMPVSQGSPNTNPGSKRPPGGFTVLVVDDEEAVRRLACRMLTWTGYQALEASHGREAIATIEQHAGSVHLVLTDIKMPGMNGRELGRHVEQRWPGKPILYMSGFASEVFENGLLEPGAPFLSKPFTQDDLAQKVRGLLGG